MSDITMSLDDTLELDTIIKESDTPTDPIGNIKYEGSDSTNHNLSGIQTNTAIFDPKDSGTYTIPINGQKLTVKVTDPSTIPKSANLYGEWDGADFDSSNDLWPDKQNNNDLTGVEPTESDINGSPAMYASGSGEVGVDTDNLSDAISLPYTLAFAFKYETNVSSSNNEENPLSSGDSSNGKVGILGQDSSGGYRQFSGSFVDGGTIDLKSHTAVAVFDGSNSLIEIDNSQINSGDAGSREFDTGDSFGLGNNTSGNTVDVKISYALVWDARLDSTERSDTHNFLTSFI